MGVPADQDLAAQQAKLIERDMRTAADSMIVSYIIDAIRDTYDPGKDPDDRLRPERVAAFRLAVYRGLVVVPQVLKETNPDYSQTSSRDAGDPSDGKEDE